MDDAADFFGLPAIPGPDYRGPIDHHVLRCFPKLSRGSKHLAHGRYPERR